MAENELPTLDETFNEDGPSLDDTINSVADALYDGEQDTPGDEPAEEPQELSEDAAPEESEESDEIEGADAEEDSPVDGTEEATDQESDEGEGTVEPLSPPERWSADDKEAFDGLSREAQELVLKREADVESYLNQKSQEISGKERQLDAINNLLEPRKQQWAMEGYTPDGALNHLFALSDFAGQDPAGFIRWFSEQRGVDLDQLVGSEMESDPQLKHLQERLDRFEAMQHNQQQQTVEQQQMAVNKVVSDFAADTENHPHYSELESDIALLIPVIRGQNPGLSANEVLEQAYSKAVWANDTTRAKEMARQGESQKKASMEEKKKAAAKAKKAASVNVKSKSVPVSKGPQTLDDTLSEAYDRAVGA